MKKLKYPFSTSWQRKLLHALLVDGATLVLGDIIKAGYFEKPSHVAIASIITKLYKQYNAITHWTVKQELNKLDDNEDALREFKRIKKPIDDAEVKVVVDQARRFRLHQEIKSTVRKSIDLLEQDKVDDLFEAWNKTIAFNNESVFGIERYYFSSLKERTKLRKQNPVVLKSFIAKLDNHLHGGGFNKKELNIFLSGPSRGKSYALHHMAWASIIQQRNAVLYTLEMGWDKAAARLDAAFAGVNISGLREARERVEKKIFEAKRRYGDRLVIKEYPAHTASVDTLRAHLLQLRISGFEPEVVIVDYINLLKRDDTKSRFGGSYKDLGDVYIRLRSLAQEFNLWMISAAQSHREQRNRNEQEDVSSVITMEKIAESYEGAMHSDVIISLNSTESERNRNKLRLFIAKNRNEASHKTISINTDFARGKFYVAQRVKDNVKRKKKKKVKLKEAA